MCCWKESIEKSVLTLAWRRILLIKSNYYMWSAVSNYWNGESSQPLLPTTRCSTDYATSSWTQDGTILFWKKSDKRLQTHAGISRPTEALTWYIKAGSPRLDNKAHGYLQAIFMCGGIWLKKAISGFSSTNNYTGTYTWALGKVNPIWCSNLWQNQNHQ